jgi:hypothetical protein
MVDFFVPTNKSFWTYTNTEVNIFNISANQNQKIAMAMWHICGSGFTKSPTGL